MKYKINTEISLFNTYDVVVCGGGFAGFGAAVMAAKEGAKVLLIERTSGLGGMGFIGGVGNICYKGNVVTNGYPFDTMISLMKKMKAYGPENDYPQIINEKYGTQDNLFDHNMLPIVLQYITNIHKVDLLYHTEVIDIIKCKDKIKYVIIHNASGTQAIKAEVFIDATGNGIVAMHAGCKTLNDDEFYPDMLKSSTLMFLRKVDLNQKQEVLDEAYCDPKIDIPKIQLFYEADDKISYKVHSNISYDTTTGKGLSDLERDMRDKIPAFIRYFQENISDKYKYDYSPQVIGFREGKRILGDQILTSEDIKTHRKFDDAIAYGNFTIDTVYARENIDYYQIPRSSILAKDLVNLFVVGRCLSADRGAMSTARIMATCCLMGSSAGINAALAVKKHKNIRTIKTKDVVDILIKDSLDKDFMREKLSKSTQNTSAK